MDGAVNMIADEFQRFCPEGSLWENLERVAMSYNSEQGSVTEEQALAAYLAKRSSWPYAEHFDAISVEKDGTGLLEKIRVLAFIGQYAHMYPPQRNGFALMAELGSEDFPVDVTSDVMMRLLRRAIRCMPPSSFVKLLWPSQLHAVYMDSLEWIYNYTSLKESCMNKDTDERCSITSVRDIAAARLNE